MHSCTPNAFKTTNHVHQFFFLNDTVNTVKLSVTHVIRFPTNDYYEAVPFTESKTYTKNSVIWLLYKGLFWLLSKTYSATISKSFSNDLTFWQQSADEIKYNKNEKSIFFFPQNIYSPEELKKNHWYNCKDRELLRRSGIGSSIITFHTTPIPEMKTMSIH